VLTLVEQRPVCTVTTNNTHVANTSIQRGISGDVPDQIDGDMVRDSWWRQCPEDQNASMNAEL